MARVSATCLVDDPRFGTVGVTLYPGAGSVRVEGAGIPTVTIRRTGGTRGNGRVPVGTRRRRLAMTVGGEPAVLSPGPGRGPLRWYGVRVVHRGVDYRLTPRRRPRGRSSLARDDRPLGHFRSDGRPAPAEWRDGAGAEAVDAAVGYAAAVAFGRWKLPWWARWGERLWNLVGELLSG
ncbi:hypothetical protein [Streptomyces pini]|uniref:Uncharacterized protein n=1 Tax=Streptomyces pini TaxID=1520580 RepID=A0A1I3UMN1_9ACTN|nr:hypothetical protein [Streptomyces pini]SFJ83061.1 hypothetical protein SAMN05192584_101527 [Streptomyces pini]